MPTFHLSYTGDYLDEAGQASMDLGLDQLAATGYIETNFLKDQSPAPGDTTYWDRLYSLEITPDHVANSNGIVIFRPWVRASAFAGGAKDLIVLARAGVGYDKIDLDACTENDVVVFNAPDTLTHSTASAALTFMLMLAKRVTGQQELVRSARWDQQSKLIGDDLVGKTLGIVGLGKTGAELARLVAPFHMQILAYSPSADPVVAEAMGVDLVSDLASLLRASDFVSLHCRLQESTRDMLGERELGMMKRSAYLINVARGELIEELALVEALREGRIAGAGLDVFATEPLPITSPLLDLPNVILTPHWLPSTHRAARACRDVVVNNIIRAAQGLLPRNVLNPDVLSRKAFRTKLERFGDNRSAPGAGSVG